MLPQPIHDAAASFDSLPGVGPRASLRYAYWLVTQPKEAVLRFAKNLERLAQGIKVCDTCFEYTEESPCSICRDPRRDQAVLCVVATSQDLRVIEDTTVYRGRYHVLGGLLDPIEGRTPETLRIAPLIERLKKSQHAIQEIILALDADIPGDTTALYLHKQFALFPDLRITRLARGLPTGAALEYADAHTLADALTHRQKS